MMFPSDSWGKLGVSLAGNKLKAITNRKKNRKLSRQIRRMKKEGNQNAK